MAKIYGVHMISLRSGVTAEDFDQFVAETVPHEVSFPGWTMRVLKGERGDRAATR